ncbi:SsgA family sporulation/cell division regulator [Streptomyces sp. NPDC005533]|uniref:SsgA family sporulation/cell division regulator n=1 Tax=Streptomyces sp. NPDC005533 TaxID=3364723 RepID=UPI0036C0F1D4
MSRVSASVLIDARLDVPGGGVPLQARLSYDGEDPYVVQATFLDGPTVLARWHFDRQMLAEGLHRPVGEGEVTFSPHTGPGGDEIRVSLRSHGADGQANAVLFVQARALAEFLERTYAVIGPGEEVLDLDGLLDELLAR